MDKIQELLKAQERQRIAKDQGDADAYKSATYDRRKIVGEIGDSLDLDIRVTSHMQSAPDDFDSADDFKNLINR